MSERIITYAEAIREAIGQAMESDPSVFMLGEDIGVYGGAFGVSGDLYHRFGEERVRDTPISEMGIVGAAVGAALVGMKPIVEIQFSDFTAHAWIRLSIKLPRFTSCSAESFLFPWFCVLPLAREPEPPLSTHSHLRPGLLMFPV